MAFFILLKGLVGSGVSSLIVFMFVLKFLVKVLLGSY